MDISKIAGRLPLHATSSGLILLAHSPAAYQDKILARPLTKYTDTTLTEPAVLRRHLADIRQRGFAAMPGIIVPETTGIAVPVFGPDNTAVAALSVIVPRTEEHTAARVPRADGRGPRGFPRTGLAGRTEGNGPPKPMKGLALPFIGNLVVPLTTPLSP